MIPTFDLFGLKAPLPAFVLFVVLILALIVLVKRGEQLLRWQMLGYLAGLWVVATVLPIIYFSFVALLGNSITFASIGLIALPFFVGFCTLNVYRRLMRL